MATGRTVSRYVKFQIDDSGGTLRDIPVNAINGVGLEYEEVELTAFQDAIKGVLAGLPDATIEISGPFDNTAVQAASGSGAAPALSGSHTVLKDINGVNTPLTIGIYFGIRANWATGDPAFGITSTASNGVICTGYTVNPDGTYTAKFKPYAGSAILAWGTAAFT